MYIHKSICLNQRENTTWSPPGFVSEDQLLTLQTNHFEELSLEISHRLSVTAGVETKVFSLRLRDCHQDCWHVFPLSLIIKNIILR